MEKCNRQCNCLFLIRHFVKPWKFRKLKFILVSMHSVLGVLNSLFLSSWPIILFSSSSNSSSKCEAVDMMPTTHMSALPRAPGTSDSVRLKCREMLSSALQTGGKTCYTHLCFQTHSVWLMTWSKILGIHLAPCLVFYSNTHVNDDSVGWTRALIPSFWHIKPCVYLKMMMESCCCTSKETKPVSCFLAL